MTEPEFTVAPGREEPPFAGPERVLLDAWLDFHRSTLLWKCADLSTGQLRQRAVPPSSMSLLGLVRHMADVERNWFRRVLEGQDAPPLFYSDEYPDGDFDLVDDADPAEDFETYRSEVAECREIGVEHPDLDEIAVRKRQGVHKVSLRWIYLHMIEEYARHNGHADLLRECLDGRTGD